jgi:hypothetical protein
VGDVESAFFRVSDLNIVKVGEGDHGASADSARNHAIAYHANNIVDIDVAEAFTLTR